MSRSIHGPSKTRVQPWTRYACALLMSLGVGSSASGCSSLAEELGLDTIAWGRDPTTGGCPSSLPGGAAAGEECGNAKDCAGVCCSCDGGTDLPYVGAACIDGKCADMAAACAAIQDNEDQVCDDQLVINQDSGQCPDDLENGGNPGDECKSASDCQGICCTCDDGTTSYEVVQCFGVECAAEEAACATALSKDPSLCP
ncbi:MAG: hypothetical protein H6718_00890 [Polyangiaceae bacterium]|nr:hypothetical protein [Myxococcales bacterium]MCB9583919.1 hypothetical protein [Polyangiaceae bacterium]MCB9607825.1 hypothetical protein [Polyangiaceae bacterium]